MSINDFVYEFRALYLCRIFPENIWKQIANIQGEWKGIRAAGLPTKKTPNAKIDKNPHYGIKVNSQCEIFVSLTIDKTEDRLSGAYPIYFIV